MELALVALATRLGILNLCFCTSTYTIAQVYEKERELLICNCDQVSKQID